MTTAKHTVPDNNDASREQSGWSRFYDLWISENNEQRDFPAYVGHTRGKGLTMALSLTQSTLAYTGTYNSHYTMGYSFT